MKQKIVIKVHMRCGKCRKEAMKIAATSDGVISVALQGSDKDQIVVIGNDVDSAGLCTALRKKMKGATLLSVEEVKDPKPGDKKEEEKKKSEEKKEEKKAEEKKPSEEKKQENSKGQAEKKKEQSEEGSSKKSETTAAGVSHHPCPGMYYHPPPQYHYQNPQCYMAVPVPPDDNSGCNIM